MQKLYPLLIKHKNILLNILFDNDEKEIYNFKNGNKIKIENLYNIKKIFPNIIHNNFYDKIELFNIAKNMIYDEKYNIIHPALFLLFYKKFLKNGFIFQEKYIDKIKYIFEIEHFNLSIKEKISNSFKIYFHLICDDEIDLIFEQNRKLKNLLYLNLNIHNYIENVDIYQGTYIDMIYDFGHNNTISIEIYKYKNTKEINLIKKNQIFANSLNKIIQYYIEDSFSSIKYELYKNLSKCFYKLDEQIGLNLFFIKCEKFNIAYCLKFTEIQKKLNSNSLTIKFMIHMLEEYGIKNINKIIKKMIKNNDLQPEFLENPNDYHKLIDPYLYEEILLNSKGVTRIFNYMKTKDFENKNIAKMFISEITSSYAKFMDNYYNMIKEYLNDSNNDILCIHKQYVYDISIKDDIELIKIFGYNLITNLIKKSNLNFHIHLPLLIKCENQEISLENIKNLLLSLNKNIQYKQFIKILEKRQLFIKNYRLINNKELINLIKNSIHQEEKNDSDEETI